MSKHGGADRTIEFYLAFRGVGAGAQKHLVGRGQRVEGGQQVAGALGTDCHPLRRRGGFGDELVERLYARLGTLRVERGSLLEVHRLWRVGRGRAVMRDAVDDLLPVRQYLRSLLTGSVVPGFADLGVMPAPVHRPTGRFMATRDQPVRQARGPGAWPERVLEGRGLPTWVRPARNRRVARRACDNA